MSHKNLKNRLMLLAKIILTTGLLYYVISLVDYEEISPLIAQLDVGLVISAIIVHIAAFAVMSYRWWLIMVASGNKIQYRKVISAYYLGLFCNNFLPTAIGGDVVRIVKLRSLGLDTNQLVFSTLIDRIIGLLAVIIMGIIGLNFSTSIHESIGNRSVTIVNSVSGFLFFISLLALNARIRDTVLRVILSKVRHWSKINNFLTYSHQNIEKLKRSKVIAKTILLSLVSQLLIVLTYYFIAKSLNIDLALNDFVLIVPIVAVFTSLPISVGGMGVREGIMVFLLGAIGVSTANAVSISLLYFAMLITITLPGGIFLLPGKRNVANSYAG